MFYYLFKDLNLPLWAIISINALGIAITLALVFMMYANAYTYNDCQNKKGKDKCELLKNNNDLPIFLIIPI